MKYERGSGFLDGLRNSKLHRTVLRIPITRTAASPLDGQKPRGARRRSQNSDCDSGRGLAFHQVGQAPDRRDFGHVISINLPHQGSLIFNASKKAIRVDVRCTYSNAIHPLAYGTTPRQAKHGPTAWATGTATDRQRRSEAGNKRKRRNRHPNRSGDNDGVEAAEAGRDP